MKTRNAVIALFSLVLIWALTVLWLTTAGPSEAPAITVTTLRGEKLSFQELRGRPVLVNFWATTCPACVKEMPHLVELYRELGPEGLQVIGIAMAYDPPNRVLALSRARRIPYPIALDIKGEAARAFGDVRLTPTSFLIAPDGRIVHRNTGELNMAKVRSLLADMLVYNPGYHPQFAQR